MYAEKLLVRRQNVGDLLAVVESLGHQRNEGKSYKIHVECKMFLLYFLCLQLSPDISVGHHLCRGMLHATILGSARIPSCFLTTFYLQSSRIKQSRLRL